MPTVTLHPPRTAAAAASTKPSPAATAAATNPLPPLLHTPSGLALLEIQGTIHFPPPTSASTTSTRVGKLVFPGYNPLLNGEEDTKWMKRVYLYVGENQRMVGEVKKLGKPFAVIGRKGEERGEEGMEVDAVEGEELEIVEVVKYKVVFSGRPEPVGGGTEEM